MNLFKLTEEIEEMYDNSVDPETGEVDLIKMYGHDKMQEQFDEIALGLAKKTKNLDAEAESLKKFKAEIAERQKRLENHSKRIKGYVAEAMNYNAKLEVRDEFITCKFGKVQDSVEIKDQSQIPEKYMKNDPKPMKTEIMKALKLEEEVPGAAIKEGGVSLRISVTNTGGK